jgi:hypothetical protein
VRQSEAHAWADVWVSGAGWLRVDPTAAVAPERVQRNMAQALPAGEQRALGALGGLINLADHAWLVQLRYRIAAINTGWNQWVLNYTPARREGVLGALGAALRDWRSWAVLGLAGALLWAWQARRARRLIDPVEALYLALQAQLAKGGWLRAPDESASAFGARLQAADPAPPRKAAVLRFLALYSAHKYGAGVRDAHLAATLKRLLEGPA